VPVFIPDNKDGVKHKDGKKFIGKHDCPYCGARSGLTILGSQAASLSSVMLGTLFASRYLEDADRKLIALSDSVQDAAHRAGFFSARTYRLNFRTALQQAVRDAVGKSGGGVALSGLAADFSRHWAAALGEEDYIATFLPADMAWLKEYDDLRRDGAISPGSELRELVDKRVAWEILSEYGLRARLGRTLERSGASVAHPDPALVEAVLADLMPALTENIGCLRGFDPALLHRFVLGLIAHMRPQGAILHPFTDGYLADRGNSFLLGKALHMPRFGPRTRAPAFLLAGVVEHGRLERLLSPTGVRRTWCMAWAERCFGPMALDIGAYLTDLYPRVLAALVRHGILGERMAGSDRAWGLLPEALRVTTDVAQLRCTTCRHEVSAAAGVEAAAWNGTPCMRSHCPGHYQPAIGGGGGDQGYYLALYGSGAVRRVVAQEHTGLLERDTRERLEHDFIHGTRRWHPNVLSATSTLEMGIDIGDLSTVLLCSVPPAQANYLQRIGRAGRRDGNALSVTAANGRPHDLYFFAEPEKMLAGAVDPPGVFLDASAILFRQFAGFTFDRWIATGITEDALPVKLGQVLGHVEGKKETAFPYSWIGFVEARQTSLLDDFVGLFKGELTAASVERLTAFVAGDEGAKFGLHWHVLDRLEALVKERASLKKQIQSLNTRIRRKEKEVPRDQNWEDDLAALRLEKNGFQQIVAQINDKDTLNFFTDEGLIPNYAFPEAGVTLRSIIYRKRREPDEQGRKYETLPPFEYERPAASAISELAPSNHFYAEGRKVQIDQIDLSASEVEHWRLCRSCAHAEKVISADPPPSCCPRCGDTLWNDGGRVQRMVRLRQVVATTSDRDSRIGDDSDDREPAFYNRQMLVDFTDRNVQDAWCIDDPDFPFGFEFLSKAWFREINFGDRRREGPDMEVAGVMAQRSGFVICKHYGKVQRPKPRDGAGDGDKERVRRNHTLTCPTQNQESPDNFVETLYLYRELQSEAIRILLPVTSFAGSDRKLHSFIAAVNLGLKLKFRGSVDHLQTWHRFEAGDGQRLCPALGGQARRRLSLGREEAVQGQSGVGQFADRQCRDGRSGAGRSRRIARPGQRPVRGSARSRAAAPGRTGGDAAASPHRRNRRRTGLHSARPAAGGGRGALHAPHGLFAPGGADRAGEGR
jgi:DEAD/DEAH box helicase domain-containing protein